MYYLKQFYLNFFVLFLLHGTVAINFKNNACYGILSYHFSALSSKCYENPDVLSNNVTSMAKRHGYKTETFFVETSDGYILKLYRISPSNEISTGSKVPVFVLHGIAVNVESWTDIGNRSLAFNLVDQGYDVWLGVLRGTMDANKHKNLTVNNPKYWNYNLDTLTNEDVNVLIEFVANQTKQKIIIVAHSMGTTLSFMYASEYPERAEQLVKGIIAMAPVVYLDDVPILKLVIPWGIPLIQIWKLLQIKGILYHEQFVHKTETIICKTLPELCNLLISTVSGRTKQFAPEDLLLFTSYWPSGTSVYQLEHFLQISRDRRFQKFNYGKANNKKIYGSEEPPIYNLTKIQIPVGLFYGQHDVLYLEKNVQRLFDELGSSQKSKLSVPKNGGEEDYFSHIDFLWSKYLRTSLYPDLYEALALFVSNNI